MQNPRVDLSMRGWGLQFWQAVDAEVRQARCRPRHGQEVKDEEGRRANKTIFCFQEDIDQGAS